LIWLACQPPEGRGKDGPPGLGWTVLEAIKHTPQQLEFALADKKAIQGLVRNMAIEQAKADGNSMEAMKQELEETRRRKREFYTGRKTI
jgi:hypothetical protein